MAVLIRIFKGSQQIQLEMDHSWRSVESCCVTNFDVVDLCVWVVPEIWCWIHSKAEPYNDALSGSGDIHISDQTEWSEHNGVWSSKTRWCQQREVSKIIRRFSKRFSALYMDSASESASTAMYYISFTFLTIPLLRCYKGVVHLSHHLVTI